MERSNGIPMEIFRLLAIVYMHYGDNGVQSHLFVNYCQQKAFVKTTETDSLLGKSRRLHCIRKTCPSNVYPLEPHFYIVKLGFAGVYLFFLFLLQNIDCGYSLEPPQRGGSNVYPQSMF